MSGFIRIERGTACFWLGFADGRIVEAAPIARKVLGKTVAQAIEYYQGSKIVLAFDEEGEGMRGV